MGSDSVWVVERWYWNRWEVCASAWSRASGLDGLKAWRNTYPQYRYRLTRYVSTRKGEPRGKR